MKRILEKSIALKLRKSERSSLIISDRAPIQSLKMRTYLSACLLIYNTIYCINIYNAIDQKKHTIVRIESHTPAPQRETRPARIMTD